MSIECNTGGMLREDIIMAYKLGRKHAIEIAAELAVNADTEIDELKSVIKRLLSCDIDENINIDGSAGAIKAAFKAVREQSPKDVRGMESLQPDAKTNNLKLALEKIASLDPLKDSEFGDTEPGECECFYQAKEIANEALK